MPTPFSDIYWPGPYEAARSALQHAPPPQVSRADRAALAACPPRSGRLRVLMITPFYGDGGGVGTAAKELSEQLRRQQIEVDVLHWWPQFTHPVLIDAAQRRIPLASLAALLGSGRDYDVLHFQSAAFSDRVQGGLSALCARYAVPVLYTIHALAAYYGEVMQASPHIGQHVQDQAELMDKAQAVVLLTRDLLPVMARHHPHYVARCRVIPNGTQLPAESATLAQARHAARARFNPHGQYPLLLYLARISAEKGINELITALPELKRRHPRCKLVIAGNHAQDPQVAAIRAALHARGLREADDFAFAGWVEGEQKTALLDIADFVVMPSYYEHMPLTALEAMARRKLVLLTDVLGVRSCFHTRQPLRRSVLPIAASRNPAALVEAVGYAVAQPQEMQHIIQRAYRQVQRHYNWRKVAQRWIALYRAQLHPGTIHEHPH
jgi:glycosyltransferase involved in cell wall biosynthesis